MWENFVPRTPLVVSMAARPFSALVAAFSGTSATSTNFPVVCLATVSPSSSVDELTPSSSVDELLAGLAGGATTPAARVPVGLLGVATDQDEEMRWSPRSKRGISVSLPASCKITSCFGGVCLECDI